jgi:hypothetical protein
MSLLEARRPVRALPSSSESSTRRGAIAACVVLVLVFGGLALASAFTSHDDGSVRVASQQPAWQRAAGQPERQLAAALTAYLKDQAAWRAGTLPAAAFVERINGHRAEMVAAAADLAAAQVPAGLVGARALAVDGAGLYAEAARVQQVALANAGAVADELAAAASRLKALADRTYDQARVLVDPNVFSQQDDDIEVRHRALMPLADLASRVGSEATGLRTLAGSAVRAEDLQQSAARLEEISARMAPQPPTGEER